MLIFYGFSKILIPQNSKFSHNTKAIAMSSPWSQIVKTNIFYNVYCLHQYQWRSISLITLYVQYLFKTSVYHVRIYLYSFTFLSICCSLLTVYVHIHNKFFSVLHNFEATGVAKTYCFTTKLFYAKLFQKATKKVNGCTKICKYCK